MNLLKAIISLVVMFFICFLLVVGAADAGSSPPEQRRASNVTFAWDTNAETDLAGYRLYQSSASGRYEYGPEHCVAGIEAGTETVTINDVPDGTWYWVLTAFDRAGNESGPSNEVTAALDATAPGAPTAVLITIIIKITQQN